MFSSARIKIMLYSRYSRIFFLFFFFVTMLVTATGLRSLACNSWPCWISGADTCRRSVTPWIPLQTVPSSKASPHCRFCTLWKYCNWPTSVASSLFCDDSVSRIPRVTDVMVIYTEQSSHKIYWSYWHTYYLQYETFARHYRAPALSCSVCRWNWLF